MKAGSRKSAGSIQSMAWENQDLRNKLSEAEESLRTIRSGDWDALIVGKEGEEQVLTLKRSEMRYRRLFESAQYGILILDPLSGRIVELNPYLIGLLGYPADALVGLCIWEVGAFRGISAVTQAFEDLQTRDFVRLDELTVKAGDGRLLTLEVLANVYLSDDEKVIQCNVTDITSRKLAEARIQRKREHLDALSAIDRVIASNTDLKSCLSEIIVHVIKELEVDAADILILNSDLQTLDCTANSGFRGKITSTTPMHLGDSLARRLILERHMVQIANVESGPEASLAARLAGEGIQSYFGDPLVAKGQINGVLEVYFRGPFEPDEQWLDFFHTLAGQTAIAIETSTLFESLQRTNSELSMAYEATIVGWSRALDLRDRETEGHSQRVTEMTLRLARALGMTQGELSQVRWGSLLHDIGKMGIPDAILLKPGPLTDEEWVIMKKHPLYAFELLSPIFYLRGALDIPHYHHEKWDGSGYPLGLKGAQIPLVARIFAVVDVWDALKSDRPYRPGWTDERVRAHLLTSAGNHFDPDVVEIFLQVSA